MKTKTGARDYKNQKSKYCFKTKVHIEFEDLISKIKAKNIVLSYSNEGLMSEQQILDILSKKGEVSIYRNPYRRFKTNAWTSDTTGLCELIFICKCFKTKTDK